ncbi:MAG: phosphoribosyl-AMP cyclohydrolase [Pseudomonadales bacterium]|jgi:phosphoribosyl-AMP cyclohydrolase|nr:phosphoribosyl-AMP cyclohydrolase [Pseudomonadales bacterium]
MPTKSLKQLERAPSGEQLGTDEVVAAMRWNDAGLIPAIAQDAASREVLMLAWMNEDALRETLRTGRACYWSRSRQAFWRKGETSGHAQQVREARVDCDGDTILLLVDQTGPACHTGRRHCFYIRLDARVAEVTLDVDVDPDTVYG